MRGNNRQQQADNLQDYEFMLSMDRDDKIKRPARVAPCLRVSIFERLRDRQPAEAWKLGFLAGWEEMR